MSVFLEYYKNKGHVFGECLSKADIDLQYIYIPKNASSWTKLNFIDLSWEVYNYHTDNFLHKHSLIVLRDPIERWLSGIAEYMFLYHKNIDNLSKSFFDIVFDRVAFDDHTDLQILFLEKINLNNCTFFWCDKNYKQNLSNFLNEQGYNNQYFKRENQNVTANDAIRSKFKSTFIEELANNSKYNQALVNYFAKDFELIKSVKFYGS